jgi:hypothetical protein
MGQQFAKYALRASAILIPLAFGIACTFYPRKIQQLGNRIKFGHDLDPYRRIKYMREFVEGPGYVQYLRILGLVCLGAAALVIYFMMGS